MSAGRRSTIVATVVSCLWITVALIGSSAAHAAACSATTNPPADIDWSTQQWDTDQEIQTNFSNARAAEGCATAMVLPAAYDTMTQQQQMLWLFNSEREARGLADLQLDPTLMSQIALNHSQEESTYGYFDHPSPINQVGVGNAFVNVGPDVVNPVFANYFFGENIAVGITPIAAVVFGYMYDDGTCCQFGHRGAILQGSFTWIGIGIVNSPNGPFYTDDFAQPATASPQYTPPAAADTNPPTIANVSYANGTATATGVADSPLNVNDTGATPLSAAVTGVVFYTNNIVENQATSTFNTVVATQTAAGSGTWTAQITVNPGDVLHAVAVDGSGNFVDVTPPPPAVNLTAGTNTVALPAGGTTAPTTANAVAASASTGTPAATPTAAALAASIDKQAGHKIVRSVAVYVGGHWQTYHPGRSRNFDLYSDQGVVVKLTSGLRWHATTQGRQFAPMRMRLHAGWNFVAVPYPYTGMTCHAVRFELARFGDRLKQITVGPAPNVGIVMRPNKQGSWGNDLTMHIPDGKGFWIDDTGAATWAPSAVGYGLAPAEIK
jgi:uncharacterized protein YkwD